MKHNFILLGLLFLMGYAHAQYESFFGQQTWVYDIVYPITCYTDNYDPNLLGCSETFTFSFNKNSVVNLRDTLYYQGNSEYSCYPVYLREDTTRGRLYSRYGFDNYENEYLICDLSLSVGDTFTLRNNVDYGEYLFWFYYELEGTMRVDSISYPLGKKVIYLSLLTGTDNFIPIGHYNVSFRFMESVGPLLGICPHNQYYEQSSGFLLCMHKDEELYYMTHEDLGCYQAGSGIKEYPQAFIKIYPNPTSQNITLDFSTENEVSGIVIIKDVIGRVCKQVDVCSKKSDISIADLPQGVYILTYMDRDMRKVSKKIVKI